MPKTHRFQSPFEHWASGLSSELLAFSVYLAVLTIVLGLTMLIERAL